MRMKVFWILLARALATVEALTNYTKLFREIEKVFPEIDTCETVIAFGLSSDGLLKAINRRFGSVILVPGSSPKMYLKTVRNLKDCYFSIASSPRDLGKIDEFQFVTGLTDSSKFTLLIDEEFADGRKEFQNERNRDFIENLKRSFPKTLHSPLLTLASEEGKTFGLYLTCMYVKSRFQIKRINLFNPKSEGFLTSRFSIKNHCNRSSLEGHVLRVNYVQIAPYIIGKDARHLRGVDVSLVKTISEQYGFDLSFTRTQAWGSYYEDTNVSTGLIKELVNDRSDLGIGTVANSYSRNLVVRYTGMIYMQSFDYVCIKPKPIDPYQNIIRPFSPLVWAYTFAMAFFTSLVFYVFYRVYKNINKDWVRKRSQLNDFFLMTFGNLIEQGELHWYKRWGSAQIAVCSWKIFTILMIWSYCCNLRAMLVKVQYTKPVDDGKDVVDQGRKVYLLGNSLPTVLLETSPIRIHQKISEQFNGEYYYLTKDGEISRENHSAIIENEGCIMYPKILIDGTSKRIYEEFGYMPYRSAKTPFGLFATGMISQKKHSPWIKEFTKVVENLFNAGIDIKLHHTFVPREAYIVEKKKQAIDPLNLKHFLSTLIIWGAGCVLSSLLFLYERCAPS